MSVWGLTGQLYCALYESPEAISEETLLDEAAFVEALKRSPDLQAAYRKCSQENRRVMMALIGEMHPFQLSSFLADTGKESDLPKVAQLGQVHPRTLSNLCELYGAETVGKYLRFGASESGYKAALNEGRLKYNEVLEGDVKGLLNCQVQLFEEKFDPVSPEITAVVRSFADLGVIPSEEEVLAKQADLKYLSQEAIAKRREEYLTFKADQEKEEQTLRQEIQLKQQKLETLATAIAAKKKEKERAAEEDIDGYRAQLRAYVGRANLVKHEGLIKSHQAFFEYLKDRWDRIDAILKEAAMEDLDAHLARKFLSAIMPASHDQKTLKAYARSVTDRYKFKFVNDKKKQERVTAHLVTLLEKYPLNSQGLDAVSVDFMGTKNINIRSKVTLGYLPYSAEELERRLESGRPESIGLPEATLVLTQNIQKPTFICPFTGAEKVQNTQDEQDLAAAMFGQYIKDFYKGIDLFNDTDWSWALHMRPEGNKLEVSLFRRLEKFGGDLAIAQVAPDEVTRDILGQLRHTPYLDVRVEELGHFVSGFPSNVLLEHALCEERLDEFIEGVFYWLPQVFTWTSAALGGVWLGKVIKDNWSSIKEWVGHQMASICFAIASKFGDRENYIEWYIESLEDNEYGIATDLILQASGSSGDIVPFQHSGYTLKTNLPDTKVFKYRYRGIEPGQEEKADLENEGALEPAGSMNIRAHTKVQIVHLDKGGTQPHWLLKIVLPREVGTKEVEAGEIRYFRLNMEMFLRTVGVSEEAFGSALKAKAPSIFNEKTLEELAKHFLENEKDEKTFERYVRKTRKDPALIKKKLDIEIKEQKPPEQAEIKAREEIKTEEEDEKAIKQLFLDLKDVKEELERAQGAGGVSRQEAAAQKLEDLTQKLMAFEAKGYDMEALGKKYGMYESVSALFEQDTPPEKPTEYVPTSPQERGEEGGPGEITTPDGAVISKEQAAQIIGQALHNIGDQVLQKQTVASKEEMPPEGETPPAPAAEEMPPEEAPPAEEEMPEEEIPEEETPEEEMPEEETPEGEEEEEEEETPPPPKKKKVKESLDEKKLSYKEKKALPASAFVYPGERKYPIHDIAHARNALARVSAHGTPAEKERVKAAVYKKYPSLKEGFDESTAARMAVDSQRGQAPKQITGLKMIGYPTLQDLYNGTNELEIQAGSEVGIVGIYSNGENVTGMKNYGYDAVGIMVPTNPMRYGSGIKGAGVAYVKTGNANQLSSEWGEVQYVYVKPSVLLPNMGLDEKEDHQGLIIGNLRRMYGLKKSMNQEPALYISQGEREELSDGKMPQSVKESIRAKKLHPFVSSLLESDEVIQNLAHGQFQAAIVEAFRLPDSFSHTPAEIGLSLAQVYGTPNVGDLLLEAEDEQDMAAMAVAPPPPPVEVPMASGEEMEADKAMMATSQEIVQAKSEAPVEIEYPLIKTDDKVKEYVAAGDMEAALARASELYPGADTMDLTRVINELQAEPYPEPAMAAPEMPAEVTVPEEPPVTPQPEMPVAVDISAAEPAEMESQYEGYLTCIRGNICEVRTAVELKKVPLSKVRVLPQGSDLNSCLAEMNQGVSLVTLAEARLFSRLHSSNLGKSGIKLTEGLRFLVFYLTETTAKVTYMLERYAGFMTDQVAVFPLGKLTETDRRKLEEDAKDLKGYHVPARSTIRLNPERLLCEQLEVPEGSEANQAAASFQDGMELLKAAERALIDFEGVAGKIISLIKLGDGGKKSARSLDKLAEMVKDGLKELKDIMNKFSDAHDTFQGEFPDAAPEETVEEMPAEEPPAEEMPEEPPVEEAPAEAPVEEPTPEAKTESILAKLSRKYNLEDLAQVHKATVGRLIWQEDRTLSSKQVAEVLQRLEEHRIC